MTQDGREIDMTRGMDESGLGMPGMTMASMSMPGMPTGSLATDTAKAQPTVPQVAQFVRYSGWPELKEALMSGRLKVAMMLAPMVMDLADKGVPVRIVALGHRSGAVIMVNKDSPARDFGDLRGKRIAIPSRFAVDHIFVRRLMREHGLGDRDLTMVEIAPPDMPAALLAGAVDAYATGEPYGAKSEMAGYGRVLYMTRDVWPKYICCVLTVREELIKSDPELVQNLVNHVMSAGQWLDSDPKHRTIAARIASERSIFNQAFELINWVMERPADRVTYGDLRLIRTEFDEMMRLAMNAKIINHPIPYETYVDESFMRRFRPVSISIQ
ncbi:MAG: ABC transporter substrate-binding protein [Gemmatimonadaceae bacterium]|nr:ABC transporter substrate-binding protein [Gemmatimonadaceae bacterium]